MALNLSDRISVIQSNTMATRVKGGVAQYALYLLGNAGATVAQKGWAKASMDGLDDMARRVGVHLLDNPDFLSVGSSITDQQLQGAVEAAINSRFIV